MRRPHPINTTGWTKGSKFIQIVTSTIYKYTHWYTWTYINIHMYAHTYHVFMHIQTHSNILSITSHPGQQLQHAKRQLCLWLYDHCWVCQMQNDRWERRQSIDMFTGWRVEQTTTELQMWDLREHVRSIWVFQIIIASQWHAPCIESFPGIILNVTYFQYV